MNPFRYGTEATVSDRCEYCGSLLGGGPGKGRPRKYCGDPCRQAAFRHRRTSAGAADRASAPRSAPVQARPLPTAPSARHSVVPPRTAGDELICELARDIQDGARDLARLLPSLDGEEPLHRITQLQEQLDGLTAAAVGRARFRRVTWAVVSSALGISEDTARHRYTDRTILRRLARFNRSETPSPVWPACSAPPHPPGARTPQVTPAAAAIPAPPAASAAPAPTHSYAVSTNGLPPPTTGWRRSCPC